MRAIYVQNGASLLYSTDHSRFSSSLHPHRLQAELPSTASTTQNAMTRYRHAGGAQTGALKKPLLSALIGAGLIVGFCATIPHWAGWREAAQKNFLSISAENGYVVQNVHVTGRDRIPADQLLRVLNIQRGMPLFAYDPQRAQDDVRQLAGIKSVFIERRWPDTIFVRLQERQPIARWQYNAQVRLVDTDGRMVVAKADEDITQYPIIVGKGATKQIVPFFKLMNGQPELWEQVRAATWVSKRRWDLTLKNGMVIKLPADNTELALSRFMKLMSRENLLERDLAVIDIRLPHQAVLRPTKRADLMIERPDFSDPGNTGKKNI
jgi:cell division protein FtsQ